ncbi:hypothetical protein EZS27_011090 [termite gut metagenome]|uniref:Uncharacterized protein n=1 Tax=termite gut metagenome TaxID=433724 RepID=A0A5J4S719_9ZZZZ
MREDVLMATFIGLSRTNDELVYFDKLRGDVLIHVQGYFSSLLGDQSIEDRKLTNRIMSREQNDFVDRGKICVDRPIEITRISRRI